MGSNTIIVIEQAAENMEEPTGVGLGTFPFSNVFSRVDEEEVGRIVGAFLKAGGTYIETAPVYQINDLMRRVLSRVPRSDYYLSTKCVTGVDKNGEKVRSGKYESILNQCDLQLTTLGVDHIDLYMVHIPPPDAPISETMSALNELEAKGKIREIGVSNVSLAQLKEFASFGRVRYIQNRQSIIYRALDPDLVNYCLDNGIRNIPYQVIERGLLTNKGAVGFELREGDLRWKKLEFGDTIRPIIAKWVRDYLKPIASERGISVEVLAVWWALQQPVTGCCAVGATRVEQIQEVMRASQLRLPPDTLPLIESAFQELPTQIVRKLVGSE
jgi:aryl-alcohol dehydrogenase-like predicted oxidoreductase